MRDGTRAFFEKQDISVTLLEHLKLKFSISIRWLDKY